MFWLKFKKFLRGSGFKSSDSGILYRKLISLRMYGPGGPTCIYGGGPQDIPSTPVIVPIQRLQVTGGATPENPPPQVKGGPTPSKTPPDHRSLDSGNDRLSGTYLRKHKDRRVTLCTQYVNLKATGSHISIKFHRGRTLCSAYLCVDRKRLISEISPISHTPVATGHVECGRVDVRITIESGGEVVIRGPYGVCRYEKALRKSRSLPNYPLPSLPKSPSPSSARSPSPRTIEFTAPPLFRNRTWLGPIIGAVVAAVITGIFALGAAYIPSRNKRGEMQIRCAKAAQCFFNCAFYQEATIIRNRLEKVVFRRNRVQSGEQLVP